LSLEVLWCSGHSVSVWWGDSLGEMPLNYAAALAALLGGSLEPLGGQNLIEAAACGCPLLIGPHTFNFADAAEQAIEAAPPSACPHGRLQCRAPSSWPRRR